MGACDTAQVWRSGDSLLEVCVVPGITLRFSGLDPFVCLVGFKLYFYFICMNVLPHLLDVRGGQKKVSDPLELELQML